MKAIVYTQYGTPDVLQLQEVEKPTPKDDEVLVEVHAASLNAGDWHFLIGKPFLIRLMGGFENPSIIYSEMIYRGGLKHLAEMSRSFSQVMRYSD